MIRMVSVKNRDRTILRIPLYPELSLCLFVKQDGMPVEQTVIQDVELSVEDVCQIAQVLRNEMAIDNLFRPTPDKQRIHQILTS